MGTEVGTGGTLVGAGGLVGTGGTLVGIGRRVGTWVGNGTGVEVGGTGVAVG